ncbi:MAG: HD domain-containing protein [Patescibacteria group bacterium]|nr:HD domain-containing protein [Patescibacteria group bacterium]
MTNHDAPAPDRLQRQLAFVREVDKLKHVFRRTWLLDGSRLENDAEHSWHLALMTFLLPEYAADERLDVMRVLKMVVVHDLVEIDAGDTYAYDSEGRKTQADRELRAADRIFALLPADQAPEFRALWEEFEARETPEARYAGALDRLQPLMHNYFTEGRAWREHGVTADQVITRCQPIEDGSPQLWRYAERLITDAVARGYLKPAPDGRGG